MAVSKLPAPNWLERTTCQGFSYRKRSRTVSNTAEEAYLRVDIPCGSAACGACPPTAPALAPAAPHLVLPDAGVLLECLEVFELPQVENVVLLSSVVRQLVDGGNMRRTARLRALYSDRRRRCVLFDNLHHRDAAPTSRTQRRDGLALLAAAEWYYQHLGSRLPLVVVSDALAQQFGDPAVDGSSSSGSGGGGGAAASASMQQQQQQQQQGAQVLGGGDEVDAELEALLQHMHIDGKHSSTGRAARGAGVSAAADSGIAGLLDSLGIGDIEGPQPQQHQQQHHHQQQQQHKPLVLEPGVHILSAAAYFGGCWGHVPAVADVFDSIQQSKAEQQQQQGSIAGPAGTASGSFRPHLSHSAVEAGLASGALLAGTLCVNRRAPGEATVAVGGGRKVVVRGRVAMNRAVHGDRVAVRLLPREQWCLAATGGGMGGDGGEEEGAEGDGGEDSNEHDLLATAGDGEADVAADDVARAGAEDSEGLEGDPLLAADGSAQGAPGQQQQVRQPTGEVVAVLQRSSADIVACIAAEDEAALSSKQASGRQESVLCIPTDRRLPKIRLRSRQLHRLLGQRLVLRLDGWEGSSRYPHGHLVRTLGPINALTSETDAVLVSSGVHWQPFSEGALRELPPVASSADYVMPAAELAARRDLRGPEYLICSIDPPGCTDVDDALSVRWLDANSSGGGGGSGNTSGSDGSGRGRRLVEVGVHIADVSYFVRQGGWLDWEAASRCTTVYLVDRRLDMLPALLSEDLCSLRADQDRYAVSVLWTLDADSFEVVDTWFGRTLIRSRYQLEYSQAQDILEGRPPPHPSHDTVSPADRPALQRNLALLSALAEHQRQQRLQSGAVELESAELRFKTDDSGRPTTVTVKQEIPMMRVVAELMILANAAVGTRIYSAFPRAALLRRHPPPRREAFAEVAVLCASLGHELNFEEGPAALSTSLAAACAAAPPALASLIKALATRAMSEAEYFCTGDVTGRGGGGMSHFGLALPFYTHFTSPIRRYADVVVHRQLLAAVAAADSGPHTTPTTTPTLPSPSTFSLAAPLAAAPALAAAVPPPLPGSEVSARAEVMNDRHRTAKRAQKECADLYLLLLLHAQPHVESATIYGLRRHSLLVFLPKYHLKAVIHLTDRQGVCKPPLRQPGDEAAADPFVAAYRRGLAVRADFGTGDGAGTDAAHLAPAQQEAPCQLSLVEAASGRQLAAYTPLQRVWVQLSADGSRAHGPTLRMQLLNDTHPAAQAAAAQEAAAAAAAATGPAAAAGAAAAGTGVAAAGCGSLPRQGAGRQAYRPPGIGSGPVAGSKQQQQPQAVPEPGLQAPPGFEGVPAGAGGQLVPAGTAGQPAGQQVAQPLPNPPNTGTGTSSSKQPLPTPPPPPAAAAAADPAGLPLPLSVAAQVDSFLVHLEAGGGGGGEGEGEAVAGPRALTWQAALPPLDAQLPSSGSSSSSSGGGNTSSSGHHLAAHHRALEQAVRQLQARAARLQLKAGSSNPSKRRAQRCSAAAEALRRQIAALQAAAVPG